jgi:tetratricopeptide (TPR) repeat protein
MNMSFRIIVVVFFLFCPVKTWGETVSLIGQADAAYAAARYADAEKFYGEAITAGADNGHVYYDLANTQFRLGKLGLAIYNYRQALLQLPADPDIRANLNLSRQKVKVRIGDADQKVLRSGAVFFLNTRWSQAELRWMFFILYSALLLAVVAERRKKSGVIRLTEIVMFAACIFVGVSVFAVRSGADGSPCWVLWTDQAKTRPAVIIADQVKAYSGDSETFQVVFVLPEGAELLSGEQRQGWVQVLLPEGRKGWVKSSEISVIVDG